MGLALMTSANTSPAAGRYPAGANAFPHRSLLGIGQLETHEIHFLLDEAEQWVALNRQSQKHTDRLAGLTIINAFFENSTRTLLSFEIAGKRLGADVVMMLRLQNERMEGQFIPSPREYRHLYGLTLERLGVAPFHDFDAALEGAEVVMMLRLQNERMEGQFVPSAREYRHLYGLTPERLARAAPDAIVMHPGPMNRGVEIDSAVADLTGRSIITDQVEMGVAIRMACLDVLTRRARGVEGWA